MHDMVTMVIMATLVVKLNVDTQTSKRAKDNSPVLFFQENFWHLTTVIYFERAV